MMKEKMPKEDEMMAEGSDESMMDQGPEVDTSEEYIEMAANGIKNVMPEDFMPVKGDFSTDAPDGEQVIMVVTGIAQGGKLTGTKGAPVPVSGGDEGEESGELDGMFGENTDA